MQIDDFVATSLEQIISGVRRAQKATMESGARINPQVESALASHLDFESGTVLQDVVFDIAVTAQEGAKSGAGLRVAAFGIGGGVEAGSDKQHSAVSRIKFIVPIVLPKHPYPPPE